MQTARYGRVEVVLPDLTDDLSPVDQLDGAGAALADFDYADADVRQLRVSGRRLARGRLRGVRADRVELSEVMLESVELQRCVFLASTWTGCTLSRVVLRGCRLVGATFADNKWANVILSNCSLEYCNLTKVRATGPIVLVDCRLREVELTGCEIHQGVLSGCQLHDVTFAGGDYTGLDLRGTDLSTIQGAYNLRGAVVGRGQRHELAEALVSELQLTYLDDQL